jgi:hypothetical protein
VLDKVSKTGATEFSQEKDLRSSINPSIKKASDIPLPKRR